MIPLTPPRVLLAVLGLTMAAHGTPPTQDRVGVDELAARRAAAAGLLSRQPTRPEVPLPDTRPEFRGILDHSQILADGSRWTVVPKGSVLHVPEQLGERVTSQPSGVFVPWTRFLALNRAWIDACNVDMDEARGEQPLAAGVAENWSRNQRLVVAVHRGGPIGVIPHSENP